MAAFAKSVGWGYPLEAELASILHAILFAFDHAVTRCVKNAMLRSMGISECSLPFSYLGVPIFHGAPRTCHLTAMADSIIAKFSKWKGHSLSLAGRKCMVNSITSISLVHSMMVYYWPRSLLKRIKTAMRNFLWTCDISKKNTSCSVSWARCSSPIDEEGQGIHSLHLANDSFVCKLAWDILCNTSLAFSLIHNRYFTPRGQPRSYGAVFHNSRGFFIVAFTKELGWGYPLEAELASIIHAILFSFDRGWHSLWVEYDSILDIQTLQRTIQLVPWQLQGL
ncbi:hypothetical protein ACS0TY_023891 [Phlomoides rotata]